MRFELYGQENSNATYCFTGASSFSGMLRSLDRSSDISKSGDAKLGSWIYSVFGITFLVVSVNNNFPKSVTLFSHTGNLIIRLLPNVIIKVVSLTH